MEITFHGAARTVTGSQHLLQIGENALLLDCGLYQGNRAEMERRNRRFPFDPGAVDAVLLSHAHLDHCGNLPNLVKQGFQGPIFATPSTADLAGLILLDSAKIHLQDARYARRHKAPGERVRPPLYGKKEAVAAFRRFDTRDFGHTFEPVKGVRCTFRPAGHILGAAVTVLELEEGGQRVRLAFSGDLGRYEIPLLVDPIVVNDIDYLILESTYGDREHEPPAHAYARLREILQSCCRNRSKVVIPSFALGRAQDLVYAMHRMMEAGEVRRMPIYLDSPLAVRLTRVYRKHSRSFDAEAQAFDRLDPHTDLLTFPEVHYIEQVQDSKALNALEGPLVIISSAGMLTGGRILHHLAQTIHDPDNVIVIVSWQAPGTLGRALVEGADEVRLFGRTFPRRARVEVINGLSAHADRSDLVDYARAVSPRRGTFLVHGEELQASALADALRDAGLANVRVPEMHSSYDL